MEAALSSTQNCRRADSSIGANTRLGREQPIGRISTLYLGCVGGELLLVRLYCEKDELERRVVLESRKAYGTLVDREILKDLQEKYNLQSEIPGRESLSIDNTHLAPEEVLEKISSHYGLKTV